MESCRNLAIGAFQVQKNMSGGKWQHSNSLRTHTHNRQLPDRCLIS